MKLYMLWVDLGDVHNLLLNKKSGYQMVYAEWFFSLIKINVHIGKYWKLICQNMNDHSSVM